MALSKVKYIARVLSGVRLKKLNHCISLVKARSGGTGAGILRDMADCARLYGAGYYDYLIFEYDKMTSAERETYMTRMSSKKLMLEMNDPAYTYLFDKKNVFYHTFSDFLGRSFLDLSRCSEKELTAFLMERDTVMVKPSEGECGKGIEKLRLEKFDSVAQAAAYIRKPENGFGVVEDAIRQHPEMMRLYPDSVNCLRMTTIVTDDGKPHMLYAVLKTGNNGNFVDNLESGGFACHVDSATGIVCGPGHTSSSISDSILAEVHPATGVAFRGFKVPFFKEACDLVCRAALVVPQVRYIGWDVCITETGPAIIEGNNYAAYDFPQLPDDSQPRFGLAGQLRQLGVKI